QQALVPDLEGPAAAPPAPLAISLVPVKAPIAEVPVPEEPVEAEPPPPLPEPASVVEPPKQEPPKKIEKRPVRQEKPVAAAPIQERAARSDLLLEQESKKHELEYQDIIVGLIAREKKYPAQAL